MNRRSPPAAPVVSAPAAQPWRSPWRGLLSLLLAWHIFAVVVPPLKNITSNGPSESPFVAGLVTATRPYNEALDLDHYYAFFAPEPGPLHLVRYKVEFADGRPAIEGRFPNLAEERPRLMYHRYFMLSESLASNYTFPSEPPRPIPPSPDDPNRFAIEKMQDAQYTPQLAQWRVARSKYEQLRKSIVAHLEQKYPGGKATVWRVEHRLLSPVEVSVDRKPLNDPDTYSDMPEDVSPPPRPLEVLP